MDNSNNKSKCGRKEGQTYKKPKYILLTIGEDDNITDYSVYPSLGKIGDALNIKYDQARYIYTHGDKAERFKSHHTRHLEKYRIVNISQASKFCVLE